MKKFLNKKLLIFFSLVIGIGIIVDYSLFKPSNINFYIATKLYSSPANSAFTDKNFYKCVVDAYNEKNNTSLPYTTNLSDEQLASIIFLSCNGYSESDESKIKDANGLNKLSSLGMLEISYSQLTNLDVSQNPNLWNLDVDSNQLTSLDVSNNSLLSSLFVRGNQLTTLDLSNNPTLDDLDVSYNQLTNLDVSNNPALGRLDVTDNQLTSLDVSQNTALTELRVSKNQLTSLDVSQNTVLENLYAQINQLTNLDVSSAISLKKIDVNGNQLATLDVSQNTALTELYAYGNQLTSLDVSNNTTLTSLNVSDNQITSLDLSNNPLLTKLAVSSNQLTNLVLSNNPALGDLDVSFNQLTSLDISKNTALTKLDVISNQLTSLDLNNNPALDRLNAQQNQLTSLDLSNNPALRSLNVSGNRITSLDVSQNTALTKLDVISNQLTSLDLSNNPALTSLNVSDNQLTTLDVSNNLALTKLDAYHNQLTSLNVSQNTALTELDVDSQMKQIYIYNDDFSSVSDSILLELVKQNGANEYDYNTKINYNFKGNTETFDLKYVINRVKLLSDKYLISDISNSYIYTKTESNNEEIFNNINLTDMENFVGIIENNKYIIKHNDDVIKEFDLINISSNKYDLTKDYIFTLNEDILSNINVLNGEKAISDNKIQIKKSQDVLQEFDIINISSDKYDLTSNSIRVQDNNIESLISNINCTNCDVKIKNDNTYKTNGEFTDGDSLVIIRNDEILKEYSLNYAVSGISLNNNNLKLNLDKKNTFKLEATVLPSSAENKNVIWESSNPDVASVDNNGNVTAHTLGNATITVKTEEGEFTANCNVTVSELNAYSVTFKGYQEGYAEEFIEGDEISFDNHFTRDGYRLIGYIYDGKEYSLIEKIIVPDYDITLEAIWELVIPDATNNNKYTIEDNYFKNINLNTDITNLDLGLDNIYTVEITKDNEVKTSGLVGTGDIINIYLGDDLVTSYTVIIKGDVTGNGEVKVADVAKLYQYLKKKITMDECYVKAGNVVDSDNEIKVSDVAKLYQYLKKKINKL